MDWAEREPEIRRRLPMRPRPTRDVKTRNPRSVETCDRLRRPRRLRCPRSARSTAECRPRAPSWVWGTRTGAEPTRPRNRKRKRGPGRKGGACLEPRPLLCALLDRGARPGSIASADPRRNLRGRHHVSGKCRGRRWLATAGLRGHKRRRGGAGVGEGASQFLGTPSETQTLPLAGTCPLLKKKRVIAISAGTKCSLFEEKRGL